MYDSAPKLTRTLYHTMYEIPWMVENLIDTHFSTYTAVGQVMLEIGRSLADSLVWLLKSLLQIRSNNLDNSI